MNNELLNNVVTSLDKVNDETKSMVFSLSKSMSELEIIQTFNQTAFDTFKLIDTISTKMNKQHECSVKGYKVLFETAIKQNIKIALEKYTLVILEFASEIYKEDEDCFMKMTIPDTKVTVGNEFSIIRSESFKKLWMILNSEDKEDIKNHVILMTTYAHAYLYKTIMKLSHANKN